MQSEDQTFCKDRLKAKMPSRPPAENHLFLIDSFTYTRSRTVGNLFPLFAIFVGKHLPKKEEIFPFSFLKFLEVTTAQKILISLTFDTLRGFLVFFPL